MNSLRTRRSQKNLSAPLAKKRKKNEHESSEHKTQESIVDLDSCADSDVKLMEAIENLAPKLGREGLRGITVEELARGVTDGALSFEGFNLSSKEWNVIFEKLRSSSNIYKEETITAELYCAISSFSVQSYAKNPSVIQTPTEKDVLKLVRTEKCGIADNSVTGERYYFAVPGRVALQGRHTRGKTPPALYSWREYGWALTTGRDSSFAYTPPHCDRGKVMSTTMPSLVYTLKIWAVFRNWQAVIDVTGKTAEIRSTPTCQDLVRYAKHDCVSLCLQGPGATVLINSSIPHAVFTLFVEDSCIQNPPINRQRVAYCSGGLCIALADFKAMYEACALCAYDKAEPGDIRQYVGIYNIFAEVPGAAEAFGCKFDVETLSYEEKKTVVDAYYNRIK